MAEADRWGPATGDAAPGHPPSTRPDADAPDQRGAAGDRGALAGRLHPGAIALWSLRGLLPVIVAVWAADLMGQALGAAMLALLLVGSWVRWLRFTWRVDDDGLVIEQGLLQRRRRVIPLERIQAVQAQRSLRHRVLGVVGLRVEAIGGSETEGQLDALTPSMARQVQHALVARRDGAAPAPDDTGAVAAAPRIATDAPGAGGDGGDGSGTAAGPAPSRGTGAHAARRPPVEIGEPLPPGTVVARCSPRQLLVAGLTGGRVGVAAAGLGIAQQIFGEGLTDWAIGLPERFGLVVLGGLIAAAAVAVFVVSVVATALAYWDFTVRRDGDLLRVQRGLLTERRDTVPLERIQSVVVEQNIVRRAFGLASVRTVVAGRAGDADGVTATLLPIGDLPQALALAGTVLAADGVGDVPLRPMPPAARSRRVVRAAWAAVLTAAAGAWAVGWPWGLAAATVVAATGVPLALAAYRSLGWAEHDGLVITRAGVLRRRTWITPATATQSVRTVASPFQRRRDLATVRIEIARAGGPRDPRLLDVATADAARVADGLAGPASQPTALAPAR
jgi:putative membrane protein